MRVLLTFCCAVFAMVLGPSLAHACDNQDTDGPDVALVLSGGGALAATHVSAIKVLEEYDVPIHCVIGTSMGAVVGGFYAAGYDADELEDLFLENNWGEIIRGDIPRRAKPYLQKELESQNFSGYVAGFNDGLTLPGGVGTMRGLKTFYRSKLSYIPPDTDFDSLRVPFRAIATDLSTGNADALADGDLVEAMLSSMAVPGAFPARQIGDKVYVDGGMSAQLPLQTALDMGADIIIAIDTSVEPKPVDATVSVVATSRQLIQIGVWKNRQEQLDLIEEKGVPFTHIIPELTGLSTTSYDPESVKKGLAYGRTAALAFESELRAIASRAAPAPANTLLQRTPAQIADRPLIVRNETTVANKTVEERFRYSETDIDRPEVVKRKLQNLASFGGFGEVDLAITPDSAVLYVDERPLGRNLIQASVQASNNFNGDSTYGLFARYSRRPLSDRGGEFSLAFEFGTDLGVTAGYYRPFGDEGRLFVVPEAFFRSENVIFDVGNQRIGEFVETYGGLRGRLGRELGDWGIIGIDSEIRVGRLSEKITTIPGFVPNDYTQGGLGLIFAADTLDRGDWPTRGFRFESSVQRLWEVGSSGSQTDKFKLSGNKAFGGDELGILLTGTYQGVRNSQDEPLEVLSLGGFRQLTAFTTNSIPTNEYAFGSAELYKRLTGTDGVVNFPVYAGGLIEFADVGFDLLAVQPDAQYFSASGYIGGETPIGPIFFGAGLGEAGEKSLFFFIGRSF